MDPMHPDAVSDTETPVGDRPAAGLPQPRPDPNEYADVAGWSTGHRSSTGRHRGTVARVWPGLSGEDVPVPPLTVAEEVHAKGG